MDNTLFALTLIAALGCGLTAGAFLVFSAGIMQALGRLAPAEGIAAMQAINITIINPFFMAAFLGTALISITAMLAALLRGDGPSVPLILIGGTLYLLGSFGSTLIFSVPMNNTLAVLTPTDPASATFWSTYLTNWTAWNTARTIASWSSESAGVSSSDASTSCSETAGASAATLRSTSASAARSTASNSRVE